MIREQKEIIKINQKIIDLKESKLVIYDKMTRDLVKLKKIDSKYFFRIIENDRVHVNYSLKSICKVFKINLGSARAMKKGNLYSIGKTKIVIEKLETERFN